MANIFAKQKEYVEKHKRNTFDLSFTNNLTFDFGELVPVFCKEVLPGDSFKILPSFGLRLMPLVFPIQTRLNANLHFFYVRNRNLWEDWPDFIGRTKQNLVPPYLSMARPTTGSLADYLGVPTTIVGDYGQSIKSASGVYLIDQVNTPDLSCVVYGSGDNGKVQPYFQTQQGGRSLSLSSLLEGSTVAQTILSASHQLGPTGFGRMYLSPLVDAELIHDIPVGYPNIGSSFYGLAGLLFRTYQNTPVQPSQMVVYIFVHRDGDWYPDYVLYKGTGTGAGSPGFSFTVNNFGYSPSNKIYRFNTSLSTLVVTPTDPLYFNSTTYTWAAFLEHLKTSIGTSQIRFGVASELPYNTSFDPTDLTEQDNPFRPDGTPLMFTTQATASGTTFRVSESIVFVDPDGMVHDISEVSGLNPFVNNNIRLNALPFRAYESIYNCFYRNQFNDPLIIDGQKEYNKFVVNRSGDGDDFNYQLHKRNYELDFLTSGRQSPVDGDITPLVGVNAAGQFTFKNSDDTVYTVTPQIGDDGHTLTGIESMEGTPENNSGLRRLMDMISLGISINDFRNVNALQRWLETNLRRGYRYKDQILSHFGVDISYEELDMPEFIGGMSEPVIVNQVNQSVDQTGDSSGLGDFSKVLGSYAGQASIFAQSKHHITKYCDEHGFIIGILSVTPVPSYSQLLPKYLIKNSVLDYYFPEFGHIGNQPVTYKEVCPIQCYAAGDSLDDVFCYQRPWYDLIASVDDVHGDFRTSLEGFIITRLFDEKPELGKKFLEVDKDTMTNPFSVTDDGDKILGTIFFDVSAQRAIPKYGIPRLE